MSKDSENGCIVHTLNEKKQTVYLRNVNGGSCLCSQNLLRNNPVFLYIWLRPDCSYMMVQRLLSSAGCAGACWYLCGSDGLYVNSEVFNPYFSLIRALQASLLPGR